ncbi:MAG: methyltransferase domain-containing protein [Anaerolineales bacterium]|nr:methyltransferase domain-containing protein [Anaerolineales bacterium]
MSAINPAQHWEVSYQNNQTVWDLGGPTPTLQRLAASGQFPPGRMLVPGAGRGHDARIFARQGFAVTAVDFAEGAVQEMHRLATPDAPLDILQADFFFLPPALHGTFDYILEYVTYCAIDPSRRAEYARVVADLLKPGGLFLGLIFPLTFHASGPPFAVSTDELLGDLLPCGFVLLHREFPADTIRPRKGREEWIVVQKQ